MFQIDAIHIIDQFHHGLFGDIITEPPTEFRSKVVFPVRKRPCAPKAPHDAAGSAADTLFHLAGNDGAVPEVDRNRYGFI